MHLPRAALIAAAIMFQSATPALSAPYDDNTWTTFAVVAAPRSQRVQAPADEYFGPERLSNLGVRNAIRDMDLEGTSPLALPIQLGRIAAVRDAIAIWADRYPQDSWLPGALLDFAKFLQSKQQPSMDDLAIGYLLWLQASYPASRAGFEARGLLNSYRPLPGFDLSVTPIAGLETNVGATLLPDRKRR